MEETLTKKHHKELVLQIFILFRLPNVIKIIQGDFKDYDFNINKSRSRAHFDGRMEQIIDSYNVEFPY